MIELSVVVPFYNPGSRLRPTIDALIKSLHESGKSFEVIAVSDGSTDGSEATIAELKAKGVDLVVLDRNYGKGEALRVGMAMASGRYVGFIDADGDIPPQLMRDLVMMAAGQKLDAVVGSKRHPEARVDSKPIRNALSGLWRVLVRILFGLPFADIQVGLKVFDGAVLREALPHTTLQGFAFDLELLVSIYDQGYSKIVEYPVEIRKRTDSTVSVRRCVRMGLDLVSVFWRLRVVPWLHRQ